jgi:SAM-dependent methyltransferase
MASEIREVIFKSMERYQKLLKPINKGWKVLEVGIDGDPLPGGNFQYFGVGNDYKTLDVLPRLHPNILADICDTKLPGGEWDLIILSQTIEHIFNWQDAIKESYRLLKDGGFLIVDCPFMCAYHGVLSTEGYDDYWRISHTALQKVLNEVGFKFGNASIDQGVLTTAMVRK